MKALCGAVLMVAMIVGTAARGQVVTPAAIEKTPLSDKQKELLEETNALLKLAAELKVSVDKSTKDQLSLDVIRKAEAVEKLARELKGKLK